ncbi:hypothetical protein EDD21DRAFT_445669 [Dissophora ornata]|nr:hypothetical protein EDD21DRAFT_445669 [Dissophora ornata]
MTLTLKESIRRVLAKKSTGTAPNDLSSASSPSASSPPASSSSTSSPPTSPSSTSSPSTSSPSTSSPPTSSFSADPPSASSSSSPNPSLSQCIAALSRNGPYNASATHASSAGSVCGSQRDRYTTMNVIIHDHPLPLVAPMHPTLASYS